MLSLKDFKWTRVPGLVDGYYEIETDYNVICVAEFRDSWLVSLCNKSEEVFDETQVDTKKEALRVASKYYERAKNRPRRSLQSDFT